MFNEADV